MYKILINNYNKRMKIAIEGCCHGKHLINIKLNI